MAPVEYSGAVTKCWLNREGLLHLERAAAEVAWERKIAVQLLWRCGFRADEVTSPDDAELWWGEDGDCWIVEVRGKNTRGGEPTLRDAWIPDDVEANIRQLSRERGRETGESLIPPL